MVNDTEILLRIIVYSNSIHVDMNLDGNCCLEGLLGEQNSVLLIMLDVK